MGGALRKLDAYPKTLDDYRVRTLPGALLSIISAIIILLLVNYEVGFFLTTQVHPRLAVDTTRGSHLQINFDVIFPHLPCAYVSLDVMDVAGGTQLDVLSAVFKKRLDRNGEPISDDEEKAHLEQELEEHRDMIKRGEECGNCYGAETPEFPCCATCEEVREAYRRKGWGFTEPEKIAQCVAERWLENIEEQKNEGCKIYGTLQVAKISGNFHFAPGKSFQKDHMHMHDMLALRQEEYNVSHVIRRLSFGADYPGIVNPLDGTSKSYSQGGNAMFQYFTKVVPTVYEHLDGSVINTNQYSVTEHMRHSPKNSPHPLLPGVFIMYELSPIMVFYYETSPSFAHLLTSLCAIIGGVFTVAGIIDSFIYHGHRSIKQKMALGKAN